MSDLHRQQDLRGHVVSWLSSAPCGKHVLTFLSTFWPFKAVRRNKRVVAIESRALRAAMREDRGVTIVVDFNNNFPGFGDFLIVVVLVNILKAAGLHVNFFGLPISGFRHKLDSNYPVIDEARQQEMLELAGKLCRVEMTLLGSDSDISGLVDDPMHVLLFRDSLIEGLDISHHCYGLINEIVVDNRLPVDAASVRRAFSHIPFIDDGRYVGFHVRSSSFDMHRNPSLLVAVADLRALLAAFPLREVRFFGESDCFEEISGHLGSSEVERFRFQRASNFQDATLEAIGSLFWFQRLGGGIGTGVMFSETPYLVLSGDVPAIRLWKANNQGPVSWRSENQLLSYAPFRATSMRVLHLLWRIKTTIDQLA